MPLQRLLTTMRLTTIRYSSFIDLNFISFRQFSVWTVIQRFAAEPLQLITLCEKAFDGVRPELVWLFDFVKAFDPKPPFFDRPSLTLCSVTIGSADRSLREVRTLITIYICQLINGHTVEKSK